MNRKLVYNENSKLEEKIFYDKLTKLIKRDNEKHFLHYTISGDFMFTGKFQ